MAAYQPTQKEAELHIFLRKECAEFKRQGIHFEGQGTIMTHIGKKWQIEKAKAAKICSSQSTSDLTEYTKAKAAEAAAIAKTIAKAKHIYAQFLSGEIVGSMV